MVTNQRRQPDVGMQRGREALQDETNAETKNNKTQKKSHGSLWEVVRESLRRGAEQALAGRNASGKYARRDSNPQPSVPKTDALSN